MTWAVTFIKDADKENVGLATATYSNGVGSGFTYGDRIEATTEGISQFDHDAKEKLAWYLEELAAQGEIATAIQNKLNGV